MNKLTFATEELVARTSLLRLLLLSFALSNPTYTYRVQRRLIPLMQQYPQSQSPYELRSYAYTIEKISRGVRATYLNGAAGPQHVSDLSIRIRECAYCRSDEWNDFFQTHKLALELLKEAQGRHKE